MKLQNINITGAIFDMDGTLLDSMGKWYTVGSDYMRSLGLTPPPTLDADLLRMSLAEAAEHLRSLGVNKPAREIQAGVDHVMDDFFLNHVQPRPGVPEFLAKLRENGVPISVATASDRAQVKNGLRRAGLLDYIDKIFTCTELDTGKHEPKVYDVARAFMGSDLASTWVFEDARHAAHTAKSAGYKVCGIFDPSEPDQPQLAALADIYIRSFEEL